jgi:DNA-binding MarR family transcriptional regulator
MARPYAPAIVVECPNREVLEQAVRFSKAILRWVDAGPDRALSYPRLRVLELLHCNGPSRMRDLADEAGLLARNLTSVADALEAEGLVQRVPHPVDRRATLLELTSDGRAAIENDLAPRLLAMSRLFDVLSPAEKSELTAVLGTLSTAMEADASG